MQKIRYLIEPLKGLTATDLTQLFAPHANSPWALLFDSAGSSHDDNRFDIMLWQPQLTLTTIGNSTTIEDTRDGSVSLSTDDPLKLAEQIHQQFIQSVETQTIENAHALPFIAGIAGSFGYDLGRRFEHLPSRFARQYSNPDMALGLYTRSLILDKREGVVYDCRPHNAEPFTIDPKPVAQSPFKLTSEWCTNTTEQQYHYALDSVNDYLHAGDCYQVNFAQRFEAKYTGDEWQAYSRLRHANQAPFSAFLKLPDSTLLSVSPERFISVKDNRVQTKPIKGTRPRSACADEDKALAEALLTSTKDRAENLMIVDLLRNDISKHCVPSSVKVPKPFALESYAAVHHMVTTIEGELDQHSTPFSLLRDAFPGGSITGAPKIRAMQIIDELEYSQRNIYCGSIGYVGLCNDMDTSICIRTLLCENQTVYCWAGGGIVLDSDADAEYQESLDKVNKILPVLYD